MDPYVHCPVVETPHFVLRLIRQEDSDALFACYHDEKAVAVMNDDNCDFGFYVDTREQMAQTVFYWLDFYKQRGFIRFAIVTKETGETVGTVEGFGGETGVLRVDISSSYECPEYLSELFNFAKENFREYFGNEILVTKAIPQARQRRIALEQCGWTFLDAFRTYRDYFQIKL